LPHHSTELAHTQIYTLSLHDALPISIYLPLIEQNLEMFQSGVSAFDVPNLVTKPFLDSFVFMGGSGTTIALLAAIFIVLRHEKRSEEHTSELQSRFDLVCRLLLENKQ